MVRGRPTRATVCARLESGISELHERLGGLPSPKESELVWDDPWHREAHHSTALEGNTLVLREVEVLLEEGRAVGAKPLKEYLEVRGYGAAARWVYRQALEPDWHDGQLISLYEVRQVHAVPLASLADQQFSVVALRLAAQRGRLDAVQGADGVWRSSRRAVQQYARTKGARRPQG